MNMELCSENELNTTTMITPDTGTATAAYLFDRTSTKQHASVGKAADGTTSSIIITFDATTSVDRIVLQNINWKGFSIYKNGTITAITLATGNLTTSSAFTGNSATTLMLHFSATNVTSLAFYITTTMAANEEKKCGQIWVMEKVMTFTDNPAASQYKVNRISKQVTHEMADGGIAFVNFATKFHADIELSFITDAFKTSLREAFDYQPNVFIPFPTGTSFDGQIYEVNWIGDWNFDQPAKNYIGSDGWKGDIKLRETPL
jgi:hypothetical protein